MAEKKINKFAPKGVTRKVISKASVTSVEPKKAEVVEESQKTDSSPQSLKTGEAVRSKKVCSFCQNKTNPSYTDIAVLRRFATDRAKIVPAAKSNVCSKHQRIVTRHIKYARHLGLLPFTPKV